MAQKRNQTALKAILVTVIIVIVLLGMVGSGLLSSFGSRSAPAPADQSQPAPDFGVEVGASGPIQVTTEPTQ